MGRRSRPVAALAGLIALVFAPEVAAEPYLFVEPRAHLVPVDFGRGVHVIPGGGLVFGAGYQVEHLGPIHIALGAEIGAGAHYGDAGLVDPVFVASVALTGGLRVGVEATVDRDALLIIAEDFRSGLAVLDPEGPERIQSAILSSTLFLGARLFVQGMSGSSLFFGLDGGIEAYMNRASALGGTAGLQVGFAFADRDAREPRK